MSFFLIALLLVPGQKPKAPGAQPDAKKAIQAVYNRMYAAFNKRDISGMMAVFAPDFSASGPAGKSMGKSEVRASLDALFHLAKEVKGEGAVQSLTSNGQTATAIVKLTVFLTAVDPRDGKELKRGQETISKDEWKKTSGKWLLKSQTRQSARSL